MAFAAHHTTVIRIVISLIGFFLHWVEEDILASLLLFLRKKRFNHVSFLSRSDNVSKAVPSTSFPTEIFNVHVSPSGCRWHFLGHGAGCLICPSRLPSPPFLSKQFTGKHATHYVLLLP